MEELGTIDCRYRWGNIRMYMVDLPTSGLLPPADGLCLRYLSNQVGIVKTGSIWCLG